MKLIPTRQQWQKWTLPSKLTAISAYLTVIGILVGVVFYLYPRSNDPAVPVARPRISLRLNPIDSSNTYCLASMQNNMFVLQYSIMYHNVGNLTAVGLDSPAEVWLNGKQVAGVKQEEINLSVLPGEELNSPKILCVAGMDPGKISALVQSVNEGKNILKMAFQMKYSPENDRSKRYRSRIQYELSRGNVFYTGREYD